MTAVDPHRGQAERGGRLVIVEQALGDVHQPIAGDAESFDLLEQSVEVAALWFVRTDVLGRDDRVELTPSRGWLAANDARSMLLRMISLKRVARRCSASAVSGNAGQSFTD